MTGRPAAALWTPNPGRTGETPLQSARARGTAATTSTALDDVPAGAGLPQGEAALEPIALQTGELFHTTELTADWVAPPFSPDGRFLLYETGAGPARVTRLLPADGSTKPTAEFAGYGAVFSPDASKLAYLSVAPRQEPIDVRSSAARSAATQATVPALARLIVRDIASGRETEIDTGVLRKTALAYGAGAILFSAAGPDGGPAQIYEAAEGRAPVARTTGDLDKVLQAINATGTALIFTTRAPGGRGAGAAAWRRPAGRRSRVLRPALARDGRITTINGSAPAFSGDGASLAYVAPRRRGDARDGRAVGRSGCRAAVVRKGAERIDAPALSPDGSRVAFQMMPNDDWEIYVVGRDGTGETRVTREIQHDLLPQFLSADRLLAVIGEAAASPLVSLRSRHRRSARGCSTTTLFARSRPSTRGCRARTARKLLIVAERDGDTVSPERGVYLMDLSKRVTRDDCARA